MEVSLSHDLPVAACISGFLAVLAAFETFIFTVAMFFTPFIFRHSLVFAQLTTTDCTCSCPSMHASLYKI